MKQKTSKLRLLALNLAIVLLCSLALPITAGAAGSGIYLGYGTRDQSGPGWTYTANDRFLELDNYRGGPIQITGDLTIYSQGNVSIKASNQEGIACRGTGNDSDGTQLQIFVGPGSMTVQGGGRSGAGIAAINTTTGGAYVTIGMMGGDLTVKGGSKGDPGIFSSFAVGILSENTFWTGPDGQNYYDGRSPASPGRINISGGGYSNDSSGILASYVILDADGIISGSGNRPAVSCDRLEIGYLDKGAATGSAVDLTLKSGSGRNNALTISPTKDLILYEHIQMDNSKFSASPSTLTLYPKTYTVTIDGNGGTYKGQSSLQVSQPYPSHVKLADYPFIRQDYALTGFLIDGKEVGLNHEFIPLKDTQIQALWKFTGTEDISDQITFSTKSSSAVYDSTSKALGTFVDPAKLATNPDAAFTYTLKKDGGQAKTVQLTDTVTDAGVYTITASYEDEKFIGTASATFTIEKATPVITGASDITVYRGTQQKPEIQLTNAYGGTLTYVSSAPDIAEVQADGTIIGKAVGTADITVSFPGNANVNAVQATFHVTVSDLPSQEVSFAEGEKNVTYGDADFTNAATNNSPGGGAITYASSNPAVATVDENGKVTILAAGKATITATAAGVDGKYAPTAVSYELTVAPKAITATVTAVDKTYDGTTAANVHVTFHDLVPGDTLTEGKDYTVTAAYDDADAGSGKTISGTVKLRSSNYTLADNDFTLNNGVIRKASALDFGVQNHYVHYQDTAAKTHSVAGLMPQQAGVSGYTLGTVDNSNAILAYYDLEPVAGSYSFALNDGLTPADADKTATAPVTIISKNYEDSSVDMTVTAVYEFVPVVDAEDIRVLYTGSPVADSEIRGTALYDGVQVPGTWSFRSGQDLTAVAHSGPKAVVFTPDDLDTYHKAETTVMVTIEKATPAGAPGYTAITSSGKTLADAGLNIGSITPGGGDLIWDLPDTTPVTRGAIYGWTYTPADTDNYNSLTGSITLWRSSSGGSGGSSSGSSVSVSTDRHGSVSISPRDPDKGDTVTLTVRPDSGYELDELTVTDRSGKTIRLSSKGNGKYTFTMPEGNVRVEATFRKISASRFTDVDRNAYYYDAVEWALGKGITGGVTADTFVPGAGCTRGQVVTFLWRAAGSPAPVSSVNPFTDVSPDAYSYNAILWAYEKGITGGVTADTFAPNRTCTRAQIVTFLPRAEGRPAVTAAGSFRDVPADAYYADAVSWAAANGITGGVTADTFAPNSTCTRAQVVTFLYRGMAN